MKYLQTSPVIERGILTSTYKQEIKRQAQIAKSKSVSQIKSSLLNQRSIESQTGTILRVALFFIFIVAITF